MNRSDPIPFAQNTAEARATGGIGHPELRDLWLAHRRWVGAILLAHKPANEDLEDLLHEVALRLVRAGHELRDPASVRPWLRTVAINVARTAGRKTRVRRAAARDVADRVSDRAERSDLGDAPAPERVSAREEAQRAMAAAQRLPEHYREPLLLRAVRGMSYRQIADTMGIPMTTVEIRLARARRMLREELESSTSDRTGPSGVATEGEES